MKKYDVFYDGVCIGFVEAVLYQDAYALAQQKAKKFLLEDEKFDVCKVKITDDFRVKKVVTANR